MMLVTNSDVEVGAWVAARIPAIGDVSAFGAFVAVGVADSAGVMVAGCVYHNYLKRYANCEISFAADTPKFATRGVIRGLLSVPFDQYKCRRVTLMVPHRAARTIRFVTGIGFVREGCIRAMYGEKQHGLIYGMTIRDYEKLRKRIG